MNHKDNDEVPQNQPDHEGETKENQKTEGNPLALRSICDLRAVVIQA